MFVGLVGAVLKMNGVLRWRELGAVLAMKAALMMKAGGAGSGDVGACGVCGVVAGSRVSADFTEWLIEGNSLAFGFAELAGRVPLSYSDEGDDQYFPSS
jgi:hypothetical protein